MKNLKINTPKTSTEIINIVINKIKKKYQDKREKSGNQNAKKASKEQLIVNEKSTCWMIKQVKTTER